MRLTVLGGGGAWPTAGRGCGGYLLEYDGFVLLIDPGYAVLPRLLTEMPAERVDAVFVSHGHPDHCADLNPLLRARVLGRAGCRPLPLYAPMGALDAVLTIDEPGMLDGGYVRREFTSDATGWLGPYEMETALLPHFVPNAGVRLSAGGAVFTYSGDCGPCPELVRLARGADVLLAEATYPDRVPAGHEGNLSTAADAGRQARAANVRRLVLTHAWPENAGRRMRLSRAWARTPSARLWRRRDLTGRSTWPSPGYASISDDVPMASVGGSVWSGA